jgi:predicted CXXCH cytochrome family protein
MFIILLVWAGSLSAQTLTLSLSTTLDQTSGTVKLNAITSATLLNKSGIGLRTAATTPSKATFDLTGMLAGDYFIAINGLVYDLIPTRITNPMAPTRQFVGKKLRVSVIGTLAIPKYKIQTFSRGQGLKAAVGYLSGTVAVPNRWAYMIVSTATGKIEIRAFPNGYPLSIFTVSKYHPLNTWIIGPANHGKTTCNSCHSPHTSKPAQYTSIIEDNGWCYKCHYGPTGTGAGIVNPRF